MPEPPLIALLETAWGLTRVRVGVRHQTYPSRFVQRLESDQGAFALKVDRQPGSMVAGSERIQQHVASALPGHAPLIRAALDGELAVVEQGSRFVLQDDVGSGAPDDSRATWGRLGAILGALHALPAIGRPFAIPVGAACDELAIQANGYPFGADLLAMLSRLRQIATSPRATLHGEVNLANAVLGRCGDIALVDWDQAGVRPIALDLGYPLICVFLHLDLTFATEHALAFYRAHASRARDAAEIPPPGEVFAAALLHALRYLPFADTDQRWARVAEAVRREPELTTLVAVGLAGA